MQNNLCFTPKLSYFLKKMNNSNVCFDSDKVKDQNSELFKLQCQSQHSSNVYVLGSEMIATLFETIFPMKFHPNRLAQPFRAANTCWCLNVSFNM